MEDLECVCHKLNYISVEQASDIQLAVGVVKACTRSWVSNLFASCTKWAFAISFIKHLKHIRSGIA